MATVSDSLVYAPRPSAVQGTKMRQNLPPYNVSTALPGQVVMFNIPCGRRGQFLSTRQSYLKFQVNNLGAVAGDTIQFDYTVNSLISRLEIYHGSNLLESIHEYGLLSHIWHDLQQSSDEQFNSGSLLEGSSMSSARTGAVLDGGTSRVFTVQLFSGILGCLMDKYLPVGELQGDLRLEITLANAPDGVITAATDPLWSLSEMELMLEYIELNSEAARMISQQNSNGYFISFDSFHNYASTLESGATNMNVLIPARYSALKTLFTVTRKQSHIASKTAKTITGRENMFGETGQWYYSIGGKPTPATPVKKNGESYAELLKSIHQLGCIGAPTMIDYTSWTQTSDGTYIISTDLEYLHGKSKLASNGVNTLSANTHLIGNLAGSLASPVRLDTFAHHESILIIQNGLAMVQF